MLENRSSYRLRDATSAWQKAQLPSGALIEQTVVFKDHLFVTLADGIVLTSADGLSFSPIETLHFTAPPRLSSLADTLFLLDETNGQCLLSTDGVSFVATIKNPPGLFGNETFLVENNSQISSVDYSGTTVQTSVLVDQTWQTPVLANFTLVGPVVVGSAQVLGIDPANSSLLWQWDGNHWVGFSLDAKVSQIIASGSVIFLQTDKGLQEFDQSLGTCRAVNSPPGTFDQITKVPNGQLFWEKGQSTLFFSPDFSTFFLPDGGWAKSAEFLDIGVFQNTIFIELFNSYGTLSLYQSVDSLTWKKVSLPTKVTLPLTIDQARVQPSGTLVEVSGAETVLPGVVASDLIYLQDATGGIQIYLSSTKGSLPNRLGNTFTAYGEISSSTAKRIVLDSQDDIVALGSKSTLNWPSRSINELAGYLGQIAKVQGQVSSTSSTSAILGGLKFHFPQASAFFKVSDTIAATGVVDQTTDGVELWYDNHYFKLVESPVAQATITAESSPDKTATSSPSQKTITTTIVKTVPVQVLSAGSAATSTPASSTTNSYSLAFLSFVLGALAMRGARFRSLLVGPRLF